MYFTPEQIQQTCGILLCNDFNTFVYYCTKCRCEFCSGKELEEHIVFDHHDKKKCVDGIFVDDGIVLDTTKTTTTTFVPFVPLVKTEIIPSAIATIVATSATVDITVPADQVADSVVVQGIADGIESKVNGKSGQEVPYKVQNELNNDCEKTKSTVKNEQTHGKPQKGTFYCEMCPGRSFRTLEVIKVHMKRHAMNDLRKPCPLCPIRPRNYEKHMQYAHTEAKPYKCDFCDASFKYNMGRVRVFFLQDHE